MMLLNYLLAMDNTKNLNTLLKEIDWLQKVINQVLKSYLLQEKPEQNWQDIPLPKLQDKEDHYTTMVKKWGLNIYQRLALVLAMTPHLKPEVLDVFFGRNKTYDRGFTAFGGVVDNNHSGFLPTGETVMFLVTATNKELRYEVMDVFSSENILMKEQVLTLGTMESHIPNYNGILALNKQWLHYFLTGKKTETKHTAAFPAQKMTTLLEWDDVVLEDATMDPLMEITTWLHHSSTIMKDWKLDQKLKPGYRALFYGAPGTGKTLTASLLGKTSNRDVYRIDLSLLVSKYIGETEKNLNKLFDMAEDKNWILFFDEADALFGKRTSVKDAHDRYANQEVSYLLQRMEEFSGVVIFSSNLKDNIDEAFTRRFQSVIPFHMPSVASRQKLWNNAFSSGCKLSPDVDLQQIAENYELSGGIINNVLRFGALKAVNRNSNIVTKNELLEGIKKEFKKENKTLNSI